MRSLVEQSASNSASERGGSRTTLRGSSASMVTRACTGLILPLDVDLAFHREDLIQDLLHDLLRGTLSTYDHEVGGDFEGIELALQKFRIHVVVFATLETLFQQPARD